MTLSKVHPCLCRWHYFILFNGWVIFYCIYAPHLYPVRLEVLETNSYEINAVMLLHCKGGLHKMGESKEGVTVFAQERRDNFTESAWWILCWVGVCYWEAGWEQFRHRAQMCLNVEMWRSWGFEKGPSCPVAWRTDVQMSEQETRVQREEDHGLGTFAKYRAPYFSCSAFSAFSCAFISEERHVPWDPRPTLPRSS